MCISEQLQKRSWECDNVVYRIMVSCINASLTTHVINPSSDYRQMLEAQVRHPYKIWMSCEVQVRTPRFMVMAISGARLAPMGRIFSSRKRKKPHDLKRCGPLRRGQRPRDLSTLHHVFVVCCACNASIVMAMLLRMLLRPPKVVAYVVERLWIPCRPGWSLVVS